LPASRTTAKASGSRSSSGLALGDAVAELVGLGTQRVVVQRLELRFQRVDLLHGLAVALEQAIVAAAEDLGQYLGEHAATGVVVRGRGQWRRRRDRRQQG
jgi:hypothetical protein